MKTYKLSEAEDLFIGEKGTKEWDEYEFELKLEPIGDMINIDRKKRNLTQEQLGELVGVKKAQISRLDVTFETVIKILDTRGQIEFSATASTIKKNFNCASFSLLPTNLLK